MKNAGSNPAFFIGYNSTTLHHRCDNREIRARDACIVRLSIKQISSVEQAGFILYLTMIRIQVRPILRPPEPRTYPLYMSDKSVIRVMYQLWERAS